MGVARYYSRRKNNARARPVPLWVAGFLGFLALLLQAFLPVAVPVTRLFDFPLLVTVYFAVLRKNKIFGVAFGTVLGIGQDALSHGYIGMMGIADAIVGYLAASVAIKLDLENFLARGLITGLLVVAHDLCLFVLLRALLNSPPSFRSLDVLSGALVNMGAALILFKLLDFFFNRGD